MSLITNVYIRSFVKAFVASAFVLVPGVLAAPSLGLATGAAVAALIACVNAGLKAVEVRLAK